MSKAIFIGGVPRSGTTLMGQILAKHRDIAALNESNLAYQYPIFVRFPRWVYMCPLEQRRCLIKVFKKLCLTKFFCCREVWEMNPMQRLIWKRLRRFEKKVWRLRFYHSRSLWCKNPVLRAIEKLWLSEAVQSRSFFFGIPKDIDSKLKAGFIGLFQFFDRNEIEQCFPILDKLESVNSVKEAYRIYGSFWNTLFNIHAQRHGKKYWCEKNPPNVLIALFFERCFDNLKIVNMVRDGRDVACSTVERPWGKKSLTKSLDMWAKSLKDSLKLQKKMLQNHYLNVRYEDLVLQTRSTLRRITDFLEVDFDDNMLSNQIYSKSIGRYQNIMTEEIKKYAKDRYGKLLKEWGYSV